MPEQRVWAETEKGSYVSSFRLTEEVHSKHVGLDQGDDRYM